MSSSQASGIDPTSFDSILAAALDAYTKKTGVVLADDPFADALKGCRSAQSVIAQFEQIQKKVLGETTRRSGKRANAMGKLKVLVPVIVSLCDTLGEGAGAAGFGPGKAVFCGIHVLLQAAQSVSASYDALVKLFEMFAGFLDRLKSYVEPPCNVSILKIVAKTMAAMLSVIALATKYIKGGWLSRFSSRPIGYRG
ncbi:hypothetical protein BC834DRAFT_1032258 [Gloeopeniophorella convolvens]|nr:hypothetical protein BC834DRAFT_1032258 [Gloeopeniophorella convolvens]